MTLKLQFESFDPRSPVNRHVNRESCISRRRRRSRTLVEGSFGRLCNSDSRDPFVEPSLCPGEAPIHSRRRRLEAWDASDIISRQCRRQKGLCAFFGALQKAYTVSHIRSVWPVLFCCGSNVFNTLYVSGWTLFRLPRWQSTSKQSTFLVGNPRVRHPVHMNPALTLLVKFV
jgi:hypothetical protein